jgi:hypothetical protein
LNEIAGEPLFGGPHPVLDLMGDPSMPDAWFGDYDHLLATGPGPAVLAQRVARFVDGAASDARPTALQVDIR